MRSVRLDEELSFREAALALGRRRDSRGRRLRNMVIARERQSGKLIALRLGGEVEPKLRVTLGALYRAFPELRPARVDELASIVRPFVERADERTRFLVREEISQDIEPRVVFLEKHAELTTEYLGKIERLKRQQLPRTATKRPSQ